MASVIDLGFVGAGVLSGRTVFSRGAGMSDSIVISFNGRPGRAAHSRSGISLQGDWASHTGFRHIPACSFDLDSPLAAALYGAAEACYIEQKACAFLVGDEHSDHGWRALSVGLAGSVEVRLPDWHKGGVAAALEAYGMVQTCPHNFRWAFLPSAGVTMEVARVVLAPVLASGTRFFDEEQLACEIDQAVVAAGYCYRRPLKEGKSQLYLFG